MKRTLQRSVERFGFRVSRTRGEMGRSKPIKGIDALAQQWEEIPGMISPARGVHHYLLAYAQSTLGDIIEVGSWQGRNTCFLAAACRDSQNGVVHAIDHFKGNPGSRDAYVVGAPDLSDLESNFRRNVRRAGLDDWVVLHAVDARTVKIQGPVRMLFVDAEHTYEALKADLAQFAPLVTSGGLVAFDDYSTSFPGVVAAVDEWLDTVDAATPVISGATLAVRLHSRA